MTRKTRDEHLFGPGPKRILALDGGGIRGIFTVQILKRMEDLLRARQPAAERANFRLCDYFDLIGGTSTGAIIAACLAVGRSVDEIEVLYKKLGASIFEPTLFRKGFMRAKFSDKPLREALEQEFAGATLGSAALHTGLGIVTKRLDTGSAWIVHNNPRGRYYAPAAGSDALANRDYLLAQVVRASAAAPHYFDGEEIEIAVGANGKTQKGSFVDGGVSPHNNPSLQLLLLATLDGHRLNWASGADKLLLVSLGTGRTEIKPRPDPEGLFNFDIADALGKRAAVNAVLSLGALMNDCAELVELLMQWFSASPGGRVIDREVGDLSNDIAGGHAMMSYARYDAVFDRQWLKDELQLDYATARVQQLSAMDEPGNMDDLSIIGRAVGSMLVKESHFPQRFNPGAFAA